MLMSPWILRYCNAAWFRSLTPYNASLALRYWYHSAQLPDGRSQLCSVYNRGGSPSRSTIYVVNWPSTNVSQDQSSRNSKTTPSTSNDTGVSSGTSSGSDISSKCTSGACSALAMLPYCSCAYAGASSASEMSSYWICGS